MPARAPAPGARPKRLRQLSPNLWSFADTCNVYVIKSGTRGALIKSGAKSIKMFGEEVPVRAQIAALEQFSDHADTPELLQWLRSFPKAPSVTYLVHGDPAASAQLRQAMISALGWHVEVAQWQQKVQVS